MEKLVLIPTRTISLVLPGILGVLCIISPVIYSKLFPQYGPGLASGQILLAGAFFICLMRNGVNYLIAANRQGRLVIFVFFALMVKIIGNFAFVKMGLGIEGIAISSSLSAAALTSTIWLTVFRIMGYRPIEYWKELSFLYSPFLLMIMAGLGMIAIFPNFFATAGEMAVIFSLIFVLVFGACIVILPPFKRWARDLAVLSASIIRAMPKRPIVTPGR